MKNAMNQRYAMLGTVMILAVGAGHRPALAESTDGNELDDQGTILEEIVVTARHRSESLQDVGQSIGALSESGIEAAGITDFADIARRIPGLDFADRGPNRNEFSIRGVSRAIPLTDALPSPNLVANYFDEIPINTPGTSQRDLPFFDINRVEVLRGPQGTLFGEGSMGGAIRTFSNDPDLDRFGVVFEATYAQTDESDGEDTRINAMVNIPLGDTFGIRATVYHRDDAGFINNLATGEIDVNDFESTGGRIVALWQPTDKLRLRAMYMKDELDQGFSWSVNSSDNTNIETLTTLHPNPDERLDETNLASLKIDYDFGPFTVSSISGVYERDDARVRFDGGVTGLFQGLVAPVLTGLAAIPIPPPAGIDPALGPAIAALGSAIATSTQDRQEEHFVQELRLVSNSDSQFNFVAGAFFRDIDWTDAQQFPLPELEPFAGTALFGDAQLGFDGQQISLYGEGTWQLNDRLKLIGGIRWFEEEVTTQVPVFLGLEIPTFFGNFGAILGGALPPSAILDAFGIFDISATDIPSDFSVVLPKLAVEYLATDDVLIFGGISKGARNGYVNSPFSTSAILVLDPATGAIDSVATARARVDATTYDPDEVVAYEIGVKSTLLDGKLQLNGGVYYNDWSDIQLQFRAAVNNTPYFDNGGDAHTMGAEIEVYYQVTDTLALYGGANVTEAELDESVVLQDVFIDPATGAPAFLVAPLVLNEGASLPHVPDYTANFGAELIFPVSTRFDLRLRGDFLYTSEAVNLIADQDKLDSYGLLNFRVGFEGEHWSASLFANNVTNEVVVLATSQPSSVPTELFVNRPRQFGLQVKYRY